jgi:hypothetical protein
MAPSQRTKTGELQRDFNGDLIRNRTCALGIVRVEKGLSEKVFKRQDVTLKCPDYMKDVSIDNGVIPHGKATDTHNNKGRM